jgi:hypothetical protein
MAPVSWILRAWLALVVGLAAATSAFAQYGADRGEYQIVQARYGTDAHNVDVTARLKELARQDRRLRITNSTFGVDPDIGAHKTLRIFARGPDGVVRAFDTTEGGTVDGAQFTSWSSGNWNAGGYGGGNFGWQGPVAGNGAADRGEYQILAARYGTEAHNIDVTHRLRELARRDTAFRITNDTFGDDPDVGAHKTLRIYARDASGAERMLEYSENGMVDGAVFTGWGGGNWGHGSGNGSWHGGGYGYGGGTAAAPADQGEYQIVQARYGTAAYNVDVTQRLQDLARRDMRFRVENSVFGDDPDVGAHKTLRIYARARDGSQRTFEYTEGGTVDGAQFTGWGSGNWDRERRPLGWEGRGVQR